MNPVDVTTEFLAAINLHDVDKLAALMTDDHAFIDSLGKTIRGREKMRQGWNAYFAMCPDYWVEHEHVFAVGNQAAVFGKAGGSILGQAWEIPAAWKAVIRDGLVQEWRVYADNKPVYEILK